MVEYVDECILFKFLTDDVLIRSQKLGTDTVRKIARFLNSGVEAAGDAKKIRQLIRVLNIH